MMIRAEIALAVVILFAAAVLIQYPTSRVIEDARAAEEAQEQPQAVIGFEGTQNFEDFRISLTISPNSIGTNAYRVFLLGDVGEVTQVRLRFRPPNPELGPSEVIADPVGPDFPNQYRAVGAFFTEPGLWEVQVDLRRRDVDDVSAVFQPEVGGTTVESGDRFDYPLTVGSWAAVAATGAMLLAVLMGVWATQWPDLPQAAPRLLRVGSATVMVIAIGAFAVSIIPDNGEGSGGNPIDPTDESVAIGRGIFMQNCAQCHGQNGEGDGPLAPTLEVPPANMRQHVPFHSDEFFFDVITLGIGDLMPAWEDTLTEEQRWHVINFLRAEFGTVATPAPSGEASQ
jgi:mono/diheme cytochrome c family protein